MACEGSGFSSPSDPTLYDSTRRLIESEIGQLKFFQLVGGSNQVEQGCGAETARRMAAFRQEDGQIGKCACWP